jgi:hypothetical protein
VSDLGVRSERPNVRVLQTLRTFRTPVHRPIRPIRTCFGRSDAIRTGGGQRAPHASLVVSKNFLPFRTAIPDTNALVSRLGKAITLDIEMPENMRKQLKSSRHTDAHTETLSDLTVRQEAFCRLYAATGVASESYTAAFDATSRAAARVNACRLLRNPKVVDRVRQLQDAAASRSVRSTAALIRELEEMVDADIGELVRLDVASCEACWPSGTDRSQEPNPDCTGCHGTGEPRVKFTSSADASPGARRLLRGIELFPNGNVKRVLLHDQMAARIELHRLRGLHVERSINLNVHTQGPALKDMSREEQLAFLESLKPTAS